MKTKKHKCLDCVTPKEWDKASKNVMKQETDEEIMNKYKFFKPKSSGSLMCFGFECDKGWFPMLDELCKNIQDTKPPKNFEVMQVKEKFGTLRFYVQHANEKIHKLIKESEEKSHSMCEMCGEPGEIRKREFWLKTLCGKHNDLWQKFAPQK